ncbi:MAG TPA: YkgJ family cysteine cluster protein, partial [Candidatus Thermoplasmatota archaeon]|nr:YkgJ family cysteine cluster protein [Candidatus Thermoplasmatota archaeon]
RTARPEEEAGALGHDIASFSRVGEDGVRYLRTRDEPRADGQRPCFFLRDGLCAAYADRPAGCRTYPFVLTTDGKVVRDEDCPHAREFPRDPATGRRLQRIAFTLHREAERRRLP